MKNLNNGYLHSIVENTSDQYGKWYEVQLSDTNNEVKCINLIAAQMDDWDKKIKDGRPEGWFKEMILENFDKIKLAVILTQGYFDLMNQPKYEVWKFVEVTMSDNSYKGSISTIAHISKVSMMENGDSKLFYVYTLNNIPKRFRFHENNLSPHGEIISAK